MRPVIVSAPHRFKMAKHFQLDIQHGHCAYKRGAESIEAEARHAGDGWPAPGRPAFSF